jgi:hypothetical protein
VVPLPLGGRLGRNVDFSENTKGNWDFAKRVLVVPLAKKAVVFTTAFFH